jgi:hypothetical protein
LRVCKFLRDFCDRRAKDRSGIFAAVGKGRHRYAEELVKSCGLEVDGENVESASQN